MTSRFIPCVVKWPHSLRHRGQQIISRVVTRATDRRCKDWRTLFLGHYNTELIYPLGKRRQPRPKQETLTSIYQITRWLFTTRYQLYDRIPMFRGLGNVAISHSAWPGDPLDYHMTHQMTCNIFFCENRELFSESPSRLGFRLLALVAIFWLAFHCFLVWWWSILFPIPPPSPSATQLSIRKRPFARMYADQPCFGTLVASTTQDDYDIEPIQSHDSFLPFHVSAQEWIEFSYSKQKKLKCLWNTIQNIEMSIRKSNGLQPVDLPSLENPWW